MTYQLLETFESLFVDGPYRHRVSTNGDRVAIRFYEDIYALGRSIQLKSRVDEGLAVLNAANTRQGVTARRGDGSFGEIVPGLEARRLPGFEVARAPIVEIEIGIEVKILAKAMIKQIDRVVSDLTGQVSHFRSKRGAPMTIGIVGVNHADQYLSFEGERTFPTDGRIYKHPYQEAQEAEARLLRHAAPAFDEFLILPFRVTNQTTGPDGAYAFDWINPKAVSMNYGSILARISQRYEARHR